MSANNTAGAAPPLTEFEHFIQVIFRPHHVIVRKALAFHSVKNRRGVIKLLKDSGRVSNLRYKDPNDVEQPVPPDIIDELEYFWSFCNYLQNRHARFASEYVLWTWISREIFEIFMELSDEEGGGKDVKYDEAMALQSEMLTSRLFKATAGGGTTGTGSSGSGTTPDPDELQLAAFNKKITFGKDRCPTMDKKEQWLTFEVGVRALLTLCDMSHLIQKNFRKPVDPKQLALYNKQNVLFYMTLQSNVTSLEGRSIVKKHSVSLDGAAVWRELSSTHQQDISGVNRARYFNKLIHSKTIPVPLKRTLVAHLIEFNSWCIEYNNYCITGQELTDQQRLTALENYISTVDVLRSAEDAMDLMGTGSNGLPLSPTERMDFYMRKATKYDDDFKEKALTSRRSVHVSELAYYDHYDPYAESGEQHDSTIDVNLAEAIEYQAYVSEGVEGSRKGYLKSEVFKTFDKKDKLAWLSLSRNARESIITHGSSGDTKPSPPVETQRALPVAQGARVNQAVTSGPTETALVPVEQGNQVIGGNVSIISAMQANRRLPALPASISGIEPTDPIRLLSSDNKSSTTRQRIAPTRDTPRNVNNANTEVSFPDLLGPSAGRSDDNESYANFNPSRTIRMAVQGRRIMTIGPGNRNTGRDQTGIDIGYVLGLSQRRIS